MGAAYTSIFADASKTLLKQMQGVPDGELPGVCIVADKSVLVLSVLFSEMSDNPG